MSSIILRERYDDFLYFLSTGPILRKLHEIAILQKFSNHAVLR